MLQPSPRRIRPARSAGSFLSHLPPSHGSTSSLRTVRSALHSAPDKQPYIPRPDGGSLPLHITADMLLSHNHNIRLCRSHPLRLLLSGTAVPLMYNTSPSGLQNHQPPFPWFLFCIRQVPGGFQKPGKKFPIAFHVRSFSLRLSIPVSNRLNCVKQFILLQ